MDSCHVTMTTFNDILNYGQKPHFTGLKHTCRTNCETDNILVFHTRKDKKVQQCARDIKVPVYITPCEYKFTSATRFIYYKIYL